MSLTVGLDDEDYMYEAAASKLIPANMKNATNWAGRREYSQHGNAMDEGVFKTIITRTYNKMVHYLVQNPRVCHL